MEDEDIDFSEISIALKAWLQKTKAMEPFVESCEFHDFDPQIILAGSTKRQAIWVAEQLNLSTLCVQLTVDAAKVVAEIDPSPVTEKILKAAQNYLDDPTDENKKEAKKAADAAQMSANVAREVADIAVRILEAERRKAAAAEAKAVRLRAVAAVAKAAIAGREIVAKNAAETATVAIENAYKTLKYRPLLINKLDDVVDEFRGNVYNSLIVELEK